MKHLFALFLLFSYSMHSQVCIGKADYFTGETQKNSEEEINNFKTTKTVFVLPEKEKANFENVIKEYWDVTKFEFISISEFEKNKEKYTFPSYSFLKFENVSLISKDKNTTWYFLNLNLGYNTLKNTKKNGKSTFETVFLSEVFLSQILNFKFRDHEDYNSGNSIMNYQIGFFKNQLQFINNNIKSNNNFNGLEDYVDGAKINQLKTKKLFILKKATENYQMFIKSDIDPALEKMLSKYKYDFEFISSEDLQSKILDKNEDLYYLLYTQVNAKKIITIINSKTGDIIYNAVDRLSYRLKDDDFTKLSKIIGK